MKKNINVRVVETEWSFANYKHTTIEILRVITMHNGSSHIDVDHIGYIRFQTDKSRYGVTDEPWYGMSYHCDTDNSKDMFDMAKVVKYLNEHRISRQPEEVLHLLQPEYYITTGSSWTSANNIGKNFYKIMLSGNRYYSHLIAKDFPEAVKAFKKWKGKNGKYDDAVLEFSHVIEAGYCEKIKP